VSAPDEPVAGGVDGDAPASPYDGLPPRAAVAMRRFELAMAALLLTVFLALLVGNHASSVSSVAPVQEGSLDTLAGWQRHLGVLAVIGLCLVTLALVFAFTVGVRLLRSLRQALPTLAPSTVALGQFLLAFGVSTLIQAGVVAGLPAASLTLEEGPAEALARLDREDASGRRRAVTPSQPLAFGGEGLPLDGERVVLHRETFASWLAVPEAASAPVELGGRPVAPGHTVQVQSGVQVRVGPYVGTYTAPDSGDILSRFALAQALAIVGLLLGCRVLGGADYLARLGLVKAGIGSEVLRGTTAWLAFLPVYMLAVFLGLGLAQLVGFPVTGHALVRTLEREGLALAPLIVLQAVVLAPVMEEILFRGFLLQGFSRPLGPSGGLWVSAFAFGCIHDGLGPLLPMTALGVLFGGLFLSSPRRSLVGSIAAHALHNAANLGLVILLVANA
jgi:membrane protease YdiL (CAAX protease family)